ncbi:MAG TPA: BTAD domain-containing putative transcriptional regulator [Roseiflexaceae bacterium]|nr:BTAD domain-containing putative transcriptional regulator [Roseiflexaceae bacterium]
MVATLHIQLLGGFDLRFDNAPITTLDQQRLQALLAHLLLHRNTPSPRQHLAFLLWPDSTEAQARANLRHLLHHLRQALPDADRFLYTDAQVLQWRQDAAFTLDVIAFEHALAQADQAERRGDQAALRIALIDAIDCYRGDLLPGWYDDWVLLERERLRQTYLATLERLVVLLEQAGEHAVAIGYAQQLLRHDPLHETSYQHLMRLYALSGDRASAVRVYQTCAAVLERELGVEPSPATREAYERLLHLEVPVERPLTPAAVARRDNLPIALTSFIGRTREIAEITQLLANTRLLTLTGAGGCGKTRLALALAGEQAAAYPDGVWFIEQAALMDEALMPQAVAATLGVREEPQRPLTTTLVDALRSRAMLLLLDNCEHLLDGCARLVQTLLSACPRLRILATSREPLGIAGETTWLVPSLGLPDPQGLPALADLVQVEAVRLFVERATATLPIFRLTETNAAAVALVCRRLDGLPLAIELAAARVKVLAMEQLVARLDDCFRLLTAGSRTALPRHQTLRAAIDWSYDLLSEPERAVFRRLAAFAGGWTLEAAETVCAGEGIAADDMLELLAHLVDKSLVLVEAQAGKAVRYRLLEPIRQYAREQLLEAGEVAATQQRHTRFFLALAETAEPQLYGAQQVLWLERLEAEHDNLRAALHWAAQRDNVALSVRLAGALWRFWAARGLWTEGWTRLAEILPLAQAAAMPRTAAWAKVLQGSAVLAFYLGDHAAARPLFEQSLAIYRQLGERPGIAWTLIYYGWLINDGGDPLVARPLLEESLAICRELGDRQGMGWALARLGLGHVFLGDLLAARPLLEESLAMCRTVGDRWGTAWALHLLAVVVGELDNTTTAIALEEESVPIWRALRDRRNRAYTLGVLGYLTIDQGEYAEAHRLLVEALTLQQAVGDKWGAALTLWFAAVLSAIQGQPERAHRLESASAALVEAIGAALPVAIMTRFVEKLALSRQTLTSDAQARAWAEGRAMTLEQAIAEALRIANETARSADTQSA